MINVKKEKNDYISPNFFAIAGDLKGKTRLVCGSDLPVVGWIEVLRRDRSNLHAFVDLASQEFR